LDLFIINKMDIAPLPTLRRKGLSEVIGFIETAGGLEKTALAQVNEKW